MSTLGMFHSAFMKATQKSLRLYFLPLGVVWKFCRNQPLTPNEKMNGFISSAVVAALAAYLLI